MEIIATATKVLEQKFKEEGFEDCFIVEIESLPGKKLNVFLDCDSGLSLRKCQVISRHLEAYIDEFVWKDTKYTLEVSSPGIQRPLKILRQYTKNIGREVKVKMIEAPEEKGTLVAADEEGITLRQKIVRKEGKKKIREKVETKFPFTKIKNTVVQISFNKKK